MPEHRQTATTPFFRLRGRTIRIFGRSFDLPASRLARIVIGILLILGGCFSILPVLGIWMLPLGFMVLSIDIAFIRRLRRRVEVRWTRWCAERRAGKQAG
ncbi:hypothetical protein [Aureimonas leprariae]|uniref:Transmembrane protein (PGPGW) n=1 Tax=Plantimonas leprariae TaxID=2615207 RepID=A0A7V7PSB8_9HYPH|nr:hypothetical protein [Aureimonas leprariae]KAB0682033.1 hypothetical protein F6X38_04315 [Aureimonas leprariae]